MQQEELDGKNRPLTDLELAEQMIDMIDGLELTDIKLGCFPPEIDTVGYNPLPFGSVVIACDYDRERLVERLRQELSEL